MSRDDEWEKWASCTQTDPELFFPTAPPTRYEQATVQEICDGCPVRLECLERALTTHSWEGTWGGVPAGERREAHTWVAAGMKPAVAARRLLQAKEELCAVS